MMATQNIGMPMYNNHNATGHGKSTLINARKGGSDSRNPPTAMESGSPVFTVRKRRICKQQRVGVETMCELIDDTVACDMLYDEKARARESEREREEKNPIGEKGGRI